MGFSAPALRLLDGGREHPLRSGYCRRSGCAEPAIDLGFCEQHLGHYHARRDAEEADLARRAAVTRRKLLERAVPEAEKEWSYALAEHMAAEGVDPESPRDESALYNAIVSALCDFVQISDAERAGLRVLGH
jgi:hypothetical protein